MTLVNIVFLSLIAALCGAVIQLTLYARQFKMQIRAILDHRKHRDGSLERYTNQMGGLVNRVNRLELDSVALKSSLNPAMASQSPRLGRLEQAIDDLQRARTNGYVSQKSADAWREGVNKQIGILNQSEADRCGREDRAWELYREQRNS